MELTGLPMQHCRVFDGGGAPRAAVGGSTPGSGVRIAALLGVLSAGLTGCAADRPLRVRIGDEIVRPQRCVVVFFVDGLGQRQFGEALAAGRIPNIARHILRRGVRVAAAVSCLPSITYANSVTLITGRYPGHHGIVSNKWFEPSSGRFQNYCFIKTYQRVDEDYRGSPTIYEILDDRVTVSIQAAMRRGCTHTIDNWATSGINWFFNNVTGVDCLVAQRFELIAKHSRRWGQWPDLIWVYFPGSDNIGHRFGPDSDQYRRAIANVDLQIGRVCEALEDIDMYDRTYLCMVSDHGMVPVGRNNVFDIPSLLRAQAGARVWSDRYSEPGDEARLLLEYDYAVATTASRWSAVYPLPGLAKRGGHEIKAFARALRMNEERAWPAAGAEGEPAAGLVDSSRAKARGGANAPRPRPGALGGPGARDGARSGMLAWLRVAVDHPAVELVACCFRPGQVHLFGGAGYSIVARTSGPGLRHRVWQHPDGGVFAPSELLDGVAEDAETDSRAWLRATADARYPDLVPQIAALFDSERAGSIVLFAAEGWDFSEDDPAGGHGSILADEMRVPMLFAGPGLPTGGVIPFARTCDVMPTLLALLGAEPVLPDGSRIDIDGVDLIPYIRAGDREIGRNDRAPWESIVQGSGVGASRCYFSGLRPTAVGR